MIDLVKTHLTHPWGPPWTLETLGNPWQPLATLGDMLENDHLGGNFGENVTFSEKAQVGFFHTIGWLDELRKNRRVGVGEIFHHKDIPMMQTEPSASSIPHGCENSASPLADSLLSLATTPSQALHSQVSQLP